MIVVFVNNLKIYKYNTSVDKTTLDLYTKIVYFVRATCFELIRSSSGPPRRQIQTILGSVFLEGLRMTL